MKKLRLDVEKLDVESFQPAEKAGPPVVEAAFWSFVDTSCSDTVWQAGCSFVTAPLDCGATVGPYAWCSEI